MKRSRFVIPRIPLIAILMAIAAITIALVRQPAPTAIVLLGGVLIAIAMSIALGPSMLIFQRLPTRNSPKTRIVFGATVGTAIGAATINLASLTGEVQQPVDAHQIQIMDNPLAPVGLVLGLVSTYLTFKFWLGD
jgi:hypothetical protein